MEALQRLHNRGSISTGYDIANSLKFEDDNDERMSKTISSTNQKTHTISLWLKRTELGYRRTWGTGQSGLNEYFFYFDASDIFNFYSYGSGYQLRFISNRVFRDTSAWYHLVFAIDTTQSTEADRVKIYVNGVQETSWSTSVYPSQNTDLQIFDKIYVGTQRNENPDFSGYISEFVYLDGTQAAVTDFGEFDEDTGIWKPIDVSDLSFGTNGCYLKFDNSSDLGEDANGGTSFTLSNITSADQATDTPTNNFCILNANFIGSYYRAPTDGGTHMPMNGVNQYAAYAGTIGVTKGKWYFETYIDTRSSSYGLTTWLGYHNFQGNYHANPYYSSTNQNALALYYPHTGQYYTWSSGSRSVTSGLGDIGASGVGKYIGFALNLDDNQITFYYDGSAVTNGSNLALNDLGTDAGNGIFALPAFSVYDNDVTVNFGGYTKAPISSAQSDANGYGTFEHAPPTGYYALCTKNLAEFG